MRPQRAIVLIVLVLGAACIDVGGPGGARVFVNPVLDSLFVGDTLSAHEVVFVDAAGDTQPPGVVHWTSLTPTVARVDSFGQIVGISRGIAIINAQARGVTGSALLVVSRPLELSLLLDTLYLMPGDTFTVPYQVLNKNGPPPPVTFSAATNSVFDIDPASGRVTALAQGGPLPFTAQADTVSAIGAVEVVTLTDTTGGKAYLSVLGTVIRHLNAGVRAVNYRRADNTPTFRLNPTITRQGVVVESVVITSLDSVGAPGRFVIASLEQEEAFGTGADPICKPLRSWGLWSSRALVPAVTALSVGGGTLIIANVQSIAARPGANAISGRFSFLAERTDFFPDPLGGLPVRGSFVVPLITDTNPC